MLIDIGINLASESYDADRDQTIARALAAGVTQLIVTGSSGASTRAAIQLARRYPGQLFATAGLHPHHAGDLTGELLEEFTTLAQASEVVAIGECGLDYFRNLAPHSAQREAFHQQLVLAEQVGKPLFLHQRDAHEDFLAILREHPNAVARGGVAHCFTGQRAQLEAYLGLGLAIGITGWICDERRGKHLLPLMRDIPAAKLMVETDGPYLLPRDLDPKPETRRNEPMYLPHIAATVARARGETFEAFAASSTAAARALFRLN